MAEFAGVVGISKVARISAGRRIVGILVVLAALFGGSANAATESDGFRFLDNLSAAVGLPHELCERPGSGIDTRCFSQSRSDPDALFDQVRGILESTSSLTSITEHYGRASKELSFEVHGPFGEAWLYFPPAWESSPDAFRAVLSHVPKLSDCSSARERVWSVVRTGDPTLSERISLSRSLTCVEDPDFQDGYGQTPLIYAADRWNRYAVLELLSAGADPNHRTAAGWTPLMYAIRSFQATEPSDPKANVPELLLGRGADPTITAPDGTFALALVPPSHVLPSDLREALEVGQLAEPATQAAQERQSVSSPHGAFLLSDAPIRAFEESPFCAAQRCRRIDTRSYSGVRDYEYAIAGYPSHSIRITINADAGFRIANITEKPYGGRLELMATYYPELANFFFGEIVPGPVHTCAPENLESVEGISGLRSNFMGRDSGFGDLVEVDGEMWSFGCQIGPDLFGVRFLQFLVGPVE